MKSVRSPHAIRPSKSPTGIAGFDEITGGGLPHDRTSLLVGGPGSGKTLFALQFLKHGARDCKEPGIRLEHYAKSGVLRMVSARTITGSAETLLVHIKTLAQAHGARCLVIDPVSTLAKTGNELTAHNVAKRLIDWSKVYGITLVCTSLLDEMTGHEGGKTALQISTIADTWIHLNYLVQAGERNRGLSIVKSRGTEHSNQVRELILSNEGVTLADIYTADGEVLMGTMRWEKESAERVANEVAEVAAKLKRVTLYAEEAVLEVRAKAVQTELVAKQVEKTLLERITASRKGELSRGHKRIRGLRGGDPAKPAPKGKMP